MAYTIPTSADTPEQAILAVASAVKGEQVTGGDGSVNRALDILADALAGENVQVPMTQQGAILALAQYVDGMVKPEGTITITENGEGIDVAQYATADVSVSGGGGGASTQTLTVTKGNESNTVSVYTISWSDYIAHNNDARVEVQPDSTDGLISVYSIPVGTAFIASISGGVVGMYLNAEMTVPLNSPAMPSAPLYAKLEY